MILKWMARMLRLSCNINWKYRQRQLVSRLLARKDSWIIRSMTIYWRSIHYLAHSVISSLFYLTRCENRELLVSQQNTFSNNINA